jgi:hypothetical protein
MKQVTHVDSVQGFNLKDGSCINSDECKMSDISYFGVNIWYGYMRITEVKNTLLPITEYLFLLS